jgi:hypothetical protein
MEIILTIRRDASRYFRGNERNQETKMGEIETNSKITILENYLEASLILRSVTSQELI